MDGIDVPPTTTRHPTAPFSVEPGNAARFTDVHCHLLPDLDDGPRGWDESLRMARMAVDDGTSTIIATPHQLGAYSHNLGDRIRQRTRQLEQMLSERAVPLRVLPGGDVRVDPDLPAKIRCGDVLTLGDHGKHVLLELPHEIYLPLEHLMDQLGGQGVAVVLSHPERNQGLLRNRKAISQLVEHGCLMQVTASSLLGSFGGESQRLAEWMLAEGLVHFLASDGHGAGRRRPLLRRAFQRACELIGPEGAGLLCSSNPKVVADGRGVVVRLPRSARRTMRRIWLPWRRAG